MNHDLIVSKIRQAVLDQCQIPGDWLDRPGLRPGDPFENSIRLYARRLYAFAMHQKGVPPLKITNALGLSHHACRQRIVRTAMKHRDKPYFMDDIATITQGIP